MVKKRRTVVQEEEAPSDQLRDLWERKAFISCGLYSQDYRLGQAALNAPVTAGTIRYFSFPMPQNYGDILIKTEQEFELPHDFFVWLETCGGSEALRRRLERKNPTPFKKICKSMFIFFPHSQRDAT